MTESGFLRYKSRHVITWTLRHFCRLHEFNGVLDSTRPFAGRTVVVVGAGPSLEGNGAHLKDAQAKGIPVVAVNASDAACRAYGVTPDVMVVRESLDGADQIEASDARMVVADVGVHPATWDAMREREGEARWFVPVYPRHIQACRRLGIRPMYGGTSAMCSAVSLAMTWGAARIVIVGCDLASAPDGRVYHSEAPRGAARAEEDLGRGVLVWSGDEQDKQRHERSGQRPHPDEQTYEYIPAQDWGELLTTVPVWQNQREWLTEEAKRRRGELDCINATEGGGGILWWRNRTLEETIEAEDTRDPVDLGTGQAIRPDQTARLREDMVVEANVIAQMSDSMVSQEGPSIGMMTHLPQVVDASRLVETLAEWRLLDAPPLLSDPDAAKRNAQSVKRCRYLYESWGTAAGEALEVLEASE